MSVGSSLRKYCANYYQLQIRRADKILDSQCKHQAKKKLLFYWRVRKTAEPTSPGEHNRRWSPHIVSHESFAARTYEFGHFHLCSKRVAWCLHFIMAFHQSICAVVEFFFSSVVCLPKLAPPMQTDDELSGWPSSTRGRRCCWLIRTRLFCCDLWCEIACDFLVERLPIGL